MVISHVPVMSAPVAKAANSVTYSFRSASVGSMLAAQRAGNSVATNAAARSVIIATA
jgi:hypothetical protein